MWTHKREKYKKCSFKADHGDSYNRGTQSHQGLREGEVFRQGHLYALEENVLSSWLSSGDKAAGPPISLEPFQGLIQDKWGDTTGSKVLRINLTPSL